MGRCASGSRRTLTDPPAAHLVHQQFRSRLLSASGTCNARESETGRGISQGVE